MKEWHKDAREMRAAGVPVSAIARFFGRHEGTVYWATDDRWREVNRERVRRRRAKAKAQAA